MFKDNFISDEEKMLDFFKLSKTEFLQSYSYLTEDEYDATAKYVAYLDGARGSTYDKHKDAVLHKAI